MHEAPRLVVSRQVRSHIRTPAERPFIGKFAREPWSHKLPDSSRCLDEACPAMQTNKCQAFRHSLETLGASDSHELRSSATNRIYVSLHGADSHRSPKTKDGKPFARHLTRPGLRRPGSAAADGAEGGRKHPAVRDRVPCPLKRSLMGGRLICPGSTDNLPD